MNRYKFLVLFLVIAFIHVNLSGNQYINHDIKAEIFPDQKSIRITDNIKLSDSFNNKKIHFLLYGNLKIDLFSENIVIKEIKGDIEARFFGINTAEFKVSDKIPLKHYEIVFKKNIKTFSDIEIRYSGEIYQELEQIGAEYARGFSETPGIISAKGVYLSGSSYWVPWFNDKLVTFKMKVISPKGWNSVSQGRLTSDADRNGRHISEWNSPEPMDEIYLISAPFHKYKIRSENVNLYAYMRTKENNLAMKYLNTTGQYLEMYNKLIGQYPYSKFALIENFWETGYGMPSFTLLGPKVIRFPFILHSSYPHELLHNWWGNSVFVNYEKGNWCEGLTVFMSDHLIKEQRGQGIEYRRTTLQGYTDYVNDENEFPVSQFKARYNASSSSIGYGKVMMIFNMLRHQFGDDLFLKSVQDFYKNNKFNKSGFEQIRKSFEKNSGKDLSKFFHQWVSLKGAPGLKITNTKISKSGGKFKLSIDLLQFQKENIYELNIPAAVYLEGEKKVKMLNLHMDRKMQTFDLTFSKRPLRIDIDPYFDVFRRLADEEIPPSLSKAFGSKKVLIVLSEKSPDDFKAQFKKLADNWSGNRKDVIDIKFDNELKTLPSDRAVWLFGWENKFRDIVAGQIISYGSSIGLHIINIGDKSVDRNSNSVILAVKNPENRSNVIVFLSSDNIKAIKGLGRKLPHYGKYSYLSFSGEEPSINHKGQWESKNSPLIKIFDGILKKKYSAPERKALGVLAPLFSKSEMISRIRFLSDPALKGRGLGTPGLDSAADYIAGKFRSYGLLQGGDENSYFQEWNEKPGASGKVVKLRNVIALIPGKKKGLKDQAVIVSAHYDHLGLGWPDVRSGNEGKIHPGADDNSSGVSVLLELARNLGNTFLPDRSILFVAFTGEENGLMGSDHFVKNYKRFPVNRIIGVINLDTVGRLSGKKPMIIGSNSAKEWKFIFMGIGYTTGIESDLITQDLDASDQISFIKRGIPGIQIFSGPNLDYHKPSDTQDKIDTEGLINIAKITREAIVYLSERVKFLTFTGKKADNRKKFVQVSGRKRASIGIMPDFTFNSGGVRVGMAIKTSDGKDHILRKGDVVIKIGGTKLLNLKEYSLVLKKYSPGDRVEITFIRAGKERKETITMRTR